MHTLTVTETKEVPVRYLQVQADVRYWEDASVDGVEDEDGTLIPCRSGESWCPLIELETGRIMNWTIGVEAEIHYKVCDAGTYSLMSGNWDCSDLKEVKKIEGYVPRIMSPGGSGYGDYIIMIVDRDAYIQNWKVNLSEWETYEE